MLKDNIIDYSKDKDFQKVKEIMHWINERARQHLTVKVVAKENNIDLKKMQNLFKFYTLCTPLAYIHGRKLYEFFKIANSDEWLDYSGYGYAVLLGFNSDSTFYKFIERMLYMKFKQFIERWKVVRKNENRL